MRVVFIFIILISNYFIACNNSMREISSVKHPEIREINKGIEYNIRLAVFLEQSINKAKKRVHRARELAVQSANGIYTLPDRKALNMEFILHLDEASRIFEVSHFNQLYLLNRNHSSWPGELFVAVDETSPAISFKLMNLDLSVLGLYAPNTPGKKHYDDKYYVPVNLNGGLPHIAKPDAALKSISRLKRALNEVSFYQARIKSWKKYLKYRHQFNIHRTNSDKEQMKSLIHSLEKDLYILTIKASNSSNNQLDRKILQAEYSVLLSALSRLTSNYSLSSSLSGLDSNKTLMTTRSSEELRIEISKNLARRQGLKP